MASVCFYFQVHQPYRLRNYTVFDQDSNYFDDVKNAQICRKVAEKVLAHEVPTSDPRYRNALYHLLTTQTSCFRYWGEGLWTDYGRELCRRTTEIIKHDF